MVTPQNFHPVHTLSPQTGGLCQTVYAVKIEGLLVSHVLTDSYLELRGGEGGISHTFVVKL